MVILLVLCNFVGCFWIYIAKNFHDEDVEGDNWIEAGGYGDYNVFELYATSVYFVMTTITTVGYGDISGNSFIERIICVVLILIGQISYSFASGAVTSIIANYDSMNETN